jgi:hypothetical protein
MPIKAASPLATIKKFSRGNADDTESIVFALHALLQTALRVICVSVAMPFLFTYLGEFMPGRAELEP